MTNRVAVVTGAAQGIGRRTAEVLAAEGYALALFDLAELPGAFRGDVSDKSDVDRFAAETLDRCGRVDVLVNNAGIADIGPAEEIPADRWRQVLEVNLT